MNNKGYIAVTCPVSSGETYVDEALERGYGVLALFENLHTEYTDMYFHVAEDNLKGRAISILCPDTIEETKEVLKEYNIVAIVAGNESGVPLADKLSHAYGLKGNGPETTWLRNNKYGMYTALKGAGLRAGETQHVNSEDDIRKFWKEFECEKVILKFTESGASVGVKTCPSLQDALDYYKVMKDMPDYLGRHGVDILIQEYIDGIEYIVDTVSCNGKHKVTSLWYYIKSEENNNFVYLRENLIKDITPKIQEIIDYDLKVLDAVQLKYGACHTEIKYDKKGPVLMETNPRLHGSQGREYLKKLFGSCPTEVSLDSFTDEEKFNKWPDIFEPVNIGLSFCTVLPKPMVIDISPGIELASHIKGYASAVLLRHNDGHEYPMTIDLASSPAIYDFYGSDEYINRLYESLRKINDDYIDLLFIRKPLEARDTPMIPETDGKTVVYDNNGLESHDKEYDVGIFAVTMSEPLQDRYKKFFELISHVKAGGKIVVPAEAYDAIPYGKKGVEAIAVLFEKKIEFDEKGTFEVTLGS